MRGKCWACIVTRPAIVEWRGAFSLTVLAHLADAMTGRNLVAPNLAAECRGNRRGGFADVFRF
jgi:hypothetical protein